jgi:hypothetical protein
LVGQISLRRTGLPSFDVPSTAVVMSSRILPSS